MTARPLWMQQPDEPDAYYALRRAANYRAWEQEQAALGRKVPALGEGLSVERSCGVGTFDGNGNPRGAGWW